MSLDIMLLLNKLAVQRLPLQVIERTVHEVLISACVVPHAAAN